MSHVCNLSLYFMEIFLSDLVLEAFFQVAHLWPNTGSCKIHDDLLFLITDHVLGWKKVSQDDIICRNEWARYKQIMYFMCDNVFFKGTSLVNDLTTNYICLKIFFGCCCCNFWFFRFFFKFDFLWIIYFDFYNNIEFIIILERFFHF